MATACLEILKNCLEIESRCSGILVEEPGSEDALVKTVFGMQDLIEYMEGCQIEAIYRFSFITTQAFFICWYLFTLSAFVPSM